MVNQFTNTINKTDCKDTLEKKCCQEKNEKKYWVLRIANKFILLDLLCKSETSEVLKISEVRKFM